MSDKLSVGHTLAKHDRLTNRKHIKLLFEEGSCLKLYPFKVFFIQKEQAQLLCNKALFAVPKKKCASAVRRNRIKRLLREAYRLHKYILDCASDISGFVFLIGYVYTGNRDTVRYAVVKKVVISSLQYFSALLDRK